MCHNWRTPMPLNLFYTDKFAAFFAGRLNNKFVIQWSLLKIPLQLTTFCCTSLHDNLKQLLHLTLIMANLIKVNKVLTDLLVVVSIQDVFLWSCLWPTLVCHAIDYKLACECILNILLWHWHWHIYWITSLQMILHKLPKFLHLLEIISELWECSTQFFTGSTPAT